MPPTISSSPSARMAATTRCPTGTSTMPRPVSARRRSTRSASPHRTAAASTSRPTPRKSPFPSFWPAESDKAGDSRHENDPPRFPQALLCRCRRLRRHAAAGPESRCCFCHPDPAGRSLSLRLPAGARGRHQDRLHQHEDRFRQPRPRQPVHPRPEAAGRFQPHGRQPQCGHHLHAGVAGRQRRASNLRRAGGDRFFNVQVLDAWTNTAAVLEAPGAYAIAYSSWEGTLPEGVRRIDIPTRTVWTIARIMLSGPDDLPNVAALQGRMQLMPLSAYPPGWPLRRKGAILRRTISSRCRRYSP